MRLPQTTATTATATASDESGEGRRQLGNDATRCSTMCQSHDVLHREAAQKPGENMGELIDEGGA